MTDRELTDNIQLLLEYRERVEELKARIVKLDLELFYLYGRITQNEGISAEQLISEIEMALANVEDRDETK